MLGAAPQKILEEGAAQFGLTAQLPLLAKYAREAIFLETTLAQAPLRPGQSRLAGRPDLPPDFAWPKSQETGAEILFLAQINLAELPAGPARDQLPAQGTLYFFGDAFVESFEHKVVYYPGTDVIQAAQTFTAPPPKTGFWKSLFTRSPKELRLCELAFRPIPSLPQFDNGEFGPELDRELATQAGKDADERCYQLMETFTPVEYATKLLGHADQIQNSELGFESQLALEKIKPTSLARLAPQREAGKDWILLFQLASDRTANMMWGDAGCLYFMIRKQDLAARQFDHVQLIPECF